MGKEEDVNRGDLRVKPDVYMAALMDEVNEHLVELSDTLNAVNKQNTPYTKHYTTPETAILVATPVEPNSPDSISNPTAIPPTPGYQSHTIYESLKRMSPKLSVINDGDDIIYVISSSEGKEWTLENPVLPGESRTFDNVYELRLRSPSAGNIAAFTGGVYRITEYDFRLAYSGLQPSVSGVFGAGIASANLTTIITTLFGEPQNAMVDVNAPAVDPLLGPNATYLGQIRDFRHSRLGFMGAVAVSDVASAAAGFRIQQSNDTVNWVDLDAVLMPGAAGARVKSAIATRFARVAYTNGAAGQALLSIGSRVMIS